MSASGSWNVTLVTPIGPQAMQLHIDATADRFTGRIEGSMGNVVAPSESHSATDIEHRR